MSTVGVLLLPALLLVAVVAGAATEVTVGAPLVVDWTKRDCMSEVPSPRACEWSMVCNATCPELSTFRVELADGEAWIFSRVVTLHPEFIRVALCQPDGEAGTCASTEEAVVEVIAVGGAPECAVARYQAQEAPHVRHTTTHAPLCCWSEACT